MKRTMKKLSLTRQTLRNLSETTLTRAGGAGRPTLNNNSCAALTGCDCSTPRTICGCGGTNPTDTELCPDTSFTGC